MLSLLEPTLRLISYFFTGIRDLFYRPPPPPGDVERGDGELGGHLERDLASVRMNEISSEEPASDPDLSCLRDVYFVGLSRSILRSHMNTQIASTRQCLFIGAKCSRYLSVTVRVYPGIDASHGCRINDLVRYQYVEKPAEDVDLFYKKDQSAFYLIRSTDGLPLVVANDLLKMYLPHVLHGSGIRQTPRVQSSIFSKVKKQQFLRQLGHT
ncbi:hypothetical protein BKA70DRAFT_1227334 [Coprinopsis sp. MPI-PUGE-AT-0042]|nr:hypothetical protein BKA70DRAFT_1227334 [Coprinopsis sp. MPI-PUGE-AT-0042]